MNGWLGLVCVRTAGGSARENHYENGEIFIALLISNGKWAKCSKLIHNFIFMVAMIKIYAFVNFHFTLLFVLANLIKRVIICYM